MRAYSSFPAISSSARRASSRAPSLLSSSSRSDPPPREEANMSYITDLLEGSQTEGKHAFQLELCNLDTRDYDPEMCLRMSETLQAQKDFIEQVEIYAAAERLRTGRAVKKG